MGLLDSFNPFRGPGTSGAAIAKRMAAKNKAPAAPQTWQDKYIKQDPNIQISREGVEDVNAVGRRFGALKEAAAGRVGSALNQNMNAVQRKFASMGAQGSGAQLKLEQLAQDQAVKQKEEAIAGIDAQEAAARDSASNRTAQLNTSQADMDFRNRVFSFERGSKMRELDIMDKQAEVDRQTTEFNKRLAMQGEKGGLLSGLLDGLL